jgi:hypothetical protein
LVRIWEVHKALHSCRRFDHYCLNAFTFNALATMADSTPKAGIEVKVFTNKEGTYKAAGMPGAPVAIPFDGSTAGAVAAVVHHEGPGLRSLVRGRWLFPPSGTDA